jgi:hypothetical protein
MKIAVKRVDKPCEIIDVNEVYRIDVAKKVLGSDIDARSLWLDAERTLAFIYDDEVCFKNNVMTNFLIEVPNVFAPIQPIRGDVAFIRTKPCNPFEQEIWDYEVEDLREQDIADIQELLSDETQIGLTLAYFLGGGA